MPDSSRPATMLTVKDRFHAQHVADIIAATERLICDLADERRKIAASRRSTRDQGAAAADLRLQALGALRLAAALLGPDLPDSDSNRLLMLIDIRWSMLPRLVG